MTKEEQALELWRRWFEENSDPWVEDDYGGVYCFFCFKEKPHHESDCVCLEAAKLLSVELKELVL